MRFSVNVHRYGRDWMIEVPSFGVSRGVGARNTLAGEARQLIGGLGSAPEKFEVGLVAGSGVPADATPDQLEELYQQAVQRTAEWDATEGVISQESEPLAEERVRDASVEELDISRPHPARMYDWYLGGKDNFAADREAGEAVVAGFPTVRLSAQTNRAFMHRATRYLAEQGIRQFVDIGTGIPTEPNLHQIAQLVRPDARVVYADNDPLVLTHARALMIGTRQGRTEYLQADICDPELLLAALRQGTTIDTTEPVALSLIAVLHFVTDEMGGPDIVKTLVEALPSGSYLAMTHFGSDLNPPEGRKFRDAYLERGLPCQGRTRAEFTAFFDGLELVAPGVTVPHRWHTDFEPVPEMDARVMLWSAVGRKP